MKKILFLVAVLTVVPCSLFAQRTMKGQYEIQAEGLYTLSSGGVSVTFGQYLINSYWDCGINATNRKKSITDGYDTYRMDFSHLEAFGDFMYRLVGTRDRRVSLYGGGGIFLGYEAYDTFNKLPENIDLESVKMDKGAFLYGVHARLEMEAFISSRLAVTVAARTPWNFSSPCRKFCVEVGAGLRYNL